MSDNEPYDLHAELITPISDDNFNKLLKMIDKIIDERKVKDNINKFDDAMSIVK